MTPAEGAVVFILFLLTLWVDLRINPRIDPNDRERHIVEYQRRIQNHE